MGRVLRAGLSVLVLVAVGAAGLPASADPENCMQQIGGQGGILPPLACLPPDAPPQDHAATYDEATDVLTLSWTAPDSTRAPDSYNVYRDGNLLTTTTDTTTDDDLTGFYGHHSYWVTGVWGTHEGDPSLPLYLARLGGNPTSCPVADVSIYTSPPDVGYEVYDDCILP